ncbi:MAG: PGF-CTERM sorting domain-containing protein [Halobacteria archaeon]|nr:PGF-CTERM sorting domain-containing protein [Halobacteria archaeon]
MAERRTRVWLAVVAAAVLVVSMAPTALAQGSVTVDMTVNGDSVSDGATVQVGASPRVVVNVTSSTTINYVEIVTDGKTMVDSSVNSMRFNTSEEVEVGFGPNVYSVTVVTKGGSKTTFEVTLDRKATTAAELQQALDRLESNVRNLKQQNQELRQRRRNLTQRNQRLRQRLSSDGNGTGNGSGSGNNANGTPGFTAVLGLVALVSSVLVARRMS